MKPQRRILVAIKDPASSTPPAVAKAARLAQALGAELELFHAMTIPISADTHLYETGSLANFERGARKRAVEQLEAMAGPLRRKKLTVRTAADWDYPAHEAIVRRARRIKAELIVADLHAGRRLAPWLLHLTDWELLRTSPFPVLLVKNDEAWGRPIVLAAIDPTHAFAKPAGLDSEILKVAARLSSALGGSLHAMHAYGPIPVGVHPEVGVGPREVANIKDAAESAARKALDRALRGTKIPARRRHLVVGSPVKAIPRTAGELGSAIVVMGAVSRSALKRVVIGNTAERVLRALPCDVLVVKPAKFVTGVSRTPRGVRYMMSTKLPLLY
ncbi:MAG TPA: universal stress protein [Steroidobacteraceae bacterium]|nr:universal stress protein [Steroidobacteraceae bacterium]HNS26493.1 universal stress protein [Steroidobacteraceae bacterium]